MIKFDRLKNLKLALSTIIFFKYSLWSWFFILQGKAINLAINNKSVYKQLIDTLIEFILIKMIVMICDVFQKFITEHFKNIALKNQWSENFPTCIYNDNKNNKNDISLLFFDLLPKLFDLEITIITNTLTIVFIFSLTIMVFLYNGFFLSIFALLLVFIFNYMSKNMFTKQIDSYQAQAFSRNIEILNWIDQYFASYKEIAKNWQGIANSSWKNRIYENYFTAKKRQIVFYLFRDLSSQLLVELPFLLSTSVVIMGVYYEYLTIAQLFIWTGFTQFMINASNAYLDNKVKIKQRTTINFKSNDILTIFKLKKLENTENKLNDKSFLSEVTLKDGTKNTLSLTPGIYHIRGENGSGKSTLMNMILHFDRVSHPFENSNFSNLMVAIEHTNTRVIERDAVVFECLDDFNSQVCGPATLCNIKWKNQINHSIAQLLETRLANQWKKIFISLEYEYISRKNKTMSSGEKVILSMMRFFASWNNKVNLLIIDECDSFLDVHKKSFLWNLSIILRHIWLSIFVPMIPL